MTPLLSQVKSFKGPFQIPSTTPASPMCLPLSTMTTTPSVQNQTSLLEPELPLLPAQWPSGRVSTLRLGHCGFDPQPSHPKDYKMVPIVSLPGIQYLGVGLSGVRPWFPTMARMLKWPKTFRCSLTSSKHCAGPFHRMCGWNIFMSKL